MAEPSKRSKSNSASKSRKSRNDIIRSTLGGYLKQKKYSMNEKFRKSDLALTQTLDQYDVTMMLDDDVAKVNSILYSNVLCLSNNHTTVDVQFSKFVKFAQSQTIPTVKSELRVLMWPLMCHIYIEMIKGRESRPAADFLRKYAHLVGPVENLNKPVVSEMNGQLQESSAEKKQPLPTSTTQISFVSEASKTTADAPSIFKANSSKSLTPKTGVELNSNDINDYFKELVQSLSLCLQIDEIESIDIVRHFRSAKYEMVLSLQSLYAVKRFLANSGHVVILHILQNWFSWDIRELLKDLQNDSDEDLTDCDEVEQNDMTNNGFASNRSELSQPQSNGDEFMCDDYDFQAQKSHCNIRDLVSKVESEIKTVNRLNGPITKSKAETLLALTTHSQPPIGQPTLISVQNKYLQNVRATVIRTRKLERPMRVFNLINANHQLTSCDLDSNECHLVCGFTDSTVRLWQLNQKNVESSSSESDSDDDSGDGAIKRPTTTGFLGYQKTMKGLKGYDFNSYGERLKSKRRQKCEFMKRRCEENSISDDGSVSLRGHNKGVTDVLFSRHNPLLFSVSKDHTMRAWKAKDYRCGAVYRGHNFPIWCVAENPTGLYLATGSRDLTAKLWSTDRHHPLKSYIGHTQDIDAIAFHPNGNYFATGSTDLTVRLWDVTSGNLLRVFIDCHLPVHCVSFSPNGQYLAVGGEESRIRIFDLAAGSQLTELKDHSAAVKSIIWNSNSTRLVSCCIDGSIRLFSVSPTSKTITNSQTLTPVASTSTSSSPSASSPQNISNKLLISNDTGCKQAFKIFYNFNGTISCFGSS